MAAGVQQGVTVPGEDGGYRERPRQTFEGHGECEGTSQRIVEDRLWANTEVAKNHSVEVRHFRRRPNPPSLGTGRKVLGRRLTGSGSLGTCFTCGQQGHKAKECQHKSQVAVAGLRRGLVVVVEAEEHRWQAPNRRKAAAGTTLAPPNKGASPKQTRPAFDGEGLVAQRTRSQAGTESGGRGGVARAKTILNGGGQPEEFVLVPEVVHRVGRRVCGKPAAPRRGECPSMPEPELQ